MNSRYILLTISTLIIINSCTINRLIIYDEDSECPTTAEGYYDHPNIWKLYYPALVLKKDKWIKYGKVLKEESDRIFFLEKKSGLFHSPDTLIFNYEYILTIIDSVGNCTYGEIPERYGEKGISVIMHLKYLEEPDFKYINLKLEPNERFSYCMIPGTYSIERMEFIHKDSINESLSVLFNEFYIAKNTNNYLGKIELTLAADEDSMLYKVPFKEVYNNSDAAVMGVAFGLIGVLIYHLTVRYDDDETKYYGFRITDDPDYSPIAGKQLKKILLH